MDKMIDIERAATYHELGHFIAIVSTLGEYVELPLLDCETKVQTGIYKSPIIEYILLSFSFGLRLECTTKAFLYPFQLDNITKACFIYSGEAAVKLVGMKKSIRLSGTDLQKARTLPVAARKKGKELAIDIIEKNLPLLEFLYSKIEKEFKREDLYFYSDTLYKWIEEYKQKI